MRMRVLRRPRVQAPRRVRRRLDAPDATTAPDPSPPPEAVFDRLTGPYGSCEYDEET